MAALDPMHDDQLPNLVGWPDLETAPSVIRCIKQTVNVSASVGTTTNWDCHLVLYPFLENMVSQINNRVNNIIHGLEGNTHLGGLCGYQVAPGAPMNAAQSPTFQIVLNDTYSTGAARVIGCGIEVVNTTAPLNKQGQLIAWRQPNANIETASSFYKTDNLVPATFQGVYSILPIAAPPADSAEAMLLPGTRQWAAEDGVYMVCPFVGEENPPLLVNYTTPGVMTTQIPDKIYNGNGNQLPIGGINTTQMVIPNPIQGLGGYGSQACRIFPLHMIGAQLLGLSKETTLAVTLNVYLETFPTPAEPDILVLAKPSAYYDPLALELFSRALTRLPVAVQAGDNVFGEWFADVVQTIADFATPVLGFIPEIGPGLAMAAQGVSKFASQYGTNAGKKENRGQSRMPEGYLVQPSPQSKPKRQPPPSSVSKSEGKSKRQRNKGNQRQREQKK